MTYTPGGRRVKHPRAANFAWNCGNGRFLYWFHNHGGRFIGELGPGGKGGRSPYDDRNPAWLMAGREIKTAGALLEGLFHQFENERVATNSLVLDVRQPFVTEVKMPTLPEFHQRDTRAEEQRGRDLRAGFSLDLWLKIDSFAASSVLLESRAENGSGLLLSTTPSGTVRIQLNDGRQEAAWESDRGTLQTGRLQHVVITVDGGPKIITFVVNGVLCDGGDERQFGWGRFSPTLRAPNGARTLKLGKAVQALRIYSHALRTSEAVGNYRAGPPR
jgi:hypothetical protein